jgi:hypothetical protein
LLIGIVLPKPHSLYFPNADHAEPAQALMFSCLFAIDSEQLAPFSPNSELSLIHLSEAKWPVASTMVPVHPIITIVQVHTYTVLRPIQPFFRTILLYGENTMERTRLYVYPSSIGRHRWVDSQPSDSKLSPLARRCCKF